MTPNSKEGPVTMHVTYRAKKGHEEALLGMVVKHWPTLDKLGLVTKEPVRLWRATDKQGRVSFVEIFQWKDGSSSDVAHQTPEVMAMWEPMSAVMDGLDLAQLEPVQNG